MELIILHGNDVASGEGLAQKLRAHGYHYFTAEQFFMDDFGDKHVDPKAIPQSLQWCAKHVTDEIGKHKDIVVKSLLVNQSLIEKAIAEGYEVTTLKIDQDEVEKSSQAVQHLIEQHDKNHPSQLKKILGKLFN